MLPETGVLSVSAVHEGWRARTLRNICNIWAGLGGQGWRHRSDAADTPLVPNAGPRPPNRAHQRRRLEASEVDTALALPGAQFVATQAGRRTKNVSDMEVLQPQQRPATPEQLLKARPAQLGRTS